MQVPDGVETVSQEATDLKRAIAGAAETLSVHPSQVDYKLDLSHFRSKTGGSVSKSTVKIIAWGADREIVEEKAPAPRAERSERRDDCGDRDDRRDRDDKPKRERAPRKEREERAPRERGNRDSGRGRERNSDRGDRNDRNDRNDRGGDRDGGRSRRLRGPEESETDASKFATKWFTTLLSQMGIEGEIAGTGSDERVHLSVTAEGAGRIIGKRGSTLAAIRHLLGLALNKQFGELVLDVDVDDPRPKGEAPRREERRGRDRDGGGRDKKRRRSRDRNDDRRDRGPKSKFDESMLQDLARKAAAKAVETGQAITFNLELNRYERRLIHLEISEIDGVDSRSEDKEDNDGNVTRIIKVVPQDD